MSTAHRRYQDSAECVHFCRPDNNAINGALPFFPFHCLREFIILALPPRMHDFFMEPRPDTQPDLFTCGIGNAAVCE